MDGSDVSGSDKVFAPSMPGNFRIPANPRDWYSYPLNFINLLVAGTRYIVPGVPQTLNIQIDAAADFYWTAGTFQACVNGVTTAQTQTSSILPFVSILINDGASNRNLMQNAVLLGNVFGNGVWPHRLQHPRLFKKNSTIAVTLANLDATNAYDVLLNFEGFKIYGT